MFLLETLPLYVISCCICRLAALSGLVVSVLATGLSVVVSGPAEGSGFLWVIKVHSAHFLRRGSKAVSPMS
jgi:hypothetical protein